MSSNSRENFFNKIFSKAELVSILLFIMLLIAVFNLEKILKESEKLEKKYIEISSSNESLKELNEKLIADNESLKELNEKLNEKLIAETVTLPMKYDFETHTWIRDSSQSCQRYKNRMNKNTEPSTTGVSAIPEEVIEEPILNQESFWLLFILCNRQGRIRNERIPLEFIILLTKMEKLKMFIYQMIILN